MKRGWRGKSILSLETQIPNQAKICPQIANSGQCVELQAHRVGFKAFLANVVGVVN